MKKIVTLVLAALILSSFCAFAATESKPDINKAIPLFLRKEYDKAGKIFLQILKDDPNDIVARYYMAEIMFTDVRKYNSAKKQFETVLQMKDKVASNSFKIRNQYIFTNSYLKLGLVHLKNGQNNKAIEYINEFLQRDKDSKARIIAFNNLAVAYSNLDDYENAIYYFQEAISLDKENLLARFNLSAINSKLIYYNTGVDLSIEGKNMEAAREFVKALDVDPFFVAAHFRLGMSHKNLRNLTDAQNEFLRAIAINPEYAYNYMIFTELADISISLEDPGKAKDYIDKAIKINDKYANSYNVLGKLAMQNEDYVSAMQNFKTASDIKYEPEFMENLKKAQEGLLKASSPK